MSRIFISYSNSQPPEIWSDFAWKLSKGGGGGGGGDDDVGMWDRVWFWASFWALVSAEFRDIPFFILHTNWEASVWWLILMAWIFSDSNVEGRLKWNCILGECFPCLVLSVDFLFGAGCYLSTFFSCWTVFASSQYTCSMCVRVCVNNFILVQVATSLNSTECFLLQSGSSVFSWNGNQCTAEQQQLAAKLAEFLKVYSIFRWAYSPGIFFFYYKWFSKVNTTKLG